MVDIEYEVIKNEIWFRLENYFQADHDKVKAWMVTENQFLDNNYPIELMIKNIKSANKLLKFIKHNIKDGTL